MGMGRSSVHELAVDVEGRIIPDRLPDAFQRVASEGRRPLALVANACSTAAGLYDRLDEIGAACRERGVWLHVDGAHGASALVSTVHRGLLSGVAQADSVVWDAHKLMRTPTLCAAVLVRDARTLDAAFQQEASYLFHDKEQPGFDFIHRTVECTKAGLGLRFFAVLASLGERGLAAYVERQFALARDELQLAVRSELIARGTHYLSTAELNGRRYLRMAFMNPETTMREVTGLIERVREIASRTKKPD